MKSSINSTSFFLCAYFFYFGNNYSKDFNFDKVFYENDYTRAHKAAAKIYYLIDELDDLETKSSRDIVFLKIWHYALTGYFYIRLMSKKNKNLNIDDICYLSRLYDKLLEKFPLTSNDLVNSSKNVIIESNETLNRLKITDTTKV